MGEDEPKSSVADSRELLQGMFSLRPAGRLAACPAHPVSVGVVYKPVCLGAADEAQGPSPQKSGSEEAEGKDAEERGSVLLPVS